jgi:hypothetical protein|uniref:Uncharacterized protein n=1 Tax=Picea glauca TaxID=3330 RepID=A0A101LXZ0_PICGL|nr:hypothetical protein ABT39_MTgene5597 [Picea glauca]
MTGSWIATPHWIVGTAFFYGFTACLNLRNLMKWAMIRILFSKPICIYLRYDLLPGTHLYSLLIMGSLELIALEGDIYVQNQQN